MCTECTVVVWMGTVHCDSRFVNSSSFCIWAAVSHAYDACHQDARCPRVVSKIYKTNTHVTHGPAVPWPSSSRFPRSRRRSHLRLCLQIMEPKVLNQPGVVCTRNVWLGDQVCKMRAVHSDLTCQCVDVHESWSITGIHDLMLVTRLAHATQSKIWGASSCAVHVELLPHVHVGLCACTHLSFRLRKPTVSQPPGKANPLTSASLADAYSLKSDMQCNIPHEHSIYVNASDADAYR